MNDPPRLIDEMQGKLAAELIAGARQEAPSAAAVHKSLLLAAGGATLMSTPPAAGATAMLTLESAAWVKLGVMLAVLGGSAAALQFGRDSAEPTRATEPVAQRTEARAPKVEPLHPPPERGETSSAPEETDTGDSHQARPVVPARAAETPSLPSPKRQLVSSQETRHEKAPEAEERLAEEVALLDRARRALAADDAKRALLHADEYLSRFPAGRLKPEARYLKMRALKMQGREGRAQAEARSLLKHDPTSLLKGAAEKILDEEPTPSKE